jgi:hypothetical protein
MSITINHQTETLSATGGVLGISGGILEEVYNLTGTALDPGNGTIQYKTLSANTQPKEQLNVY